MLIKSSIDRAVNQKFAIDGLVKQDTDRSAGSRFPALSGCTYYDLMSCLNEKHANQD